jgi:hypothetical protein
MPQSPLIQLLVSNAPKVAGDSQIQVSEDR